MNTSLEDFAMGILLALGFLSLCLLIVVLGPDLAILGLIGLVVAIAPAALLCGLLDPADPNHPLLPTERTQSFDSILVGGAIASILLGLWLSNFLNGLHQILSP